MGDTRITPTPISLWQLLWDAADVDAEVLNPHLLARHLFQEEETWDASDANMDDDDDDSERRGECSA